MGKPKSQQRYRVCGTPVRTGCITCKIRRVKCDEGKPFCKRCTSTGRKCDGYAAPGQPSLTTRKPSPNPEHPSLITDPMEQQMLLFFNTVTAPTLSGDFSSDFWERRVIQASAVEPTMVEIISSKLILQCPSADVHILTLHYEVRHATIAIGAVHNEFLSKHGFHGRVPDPSIRPFACGQYTKAISLLHGLMTTRTQQLDITLMSCILFICFDCICGNHDSAIIHLKAGLKILEDIKNQNATAISPGGSRQTHEWEREFAPLLLGLGVQAATFVNPKYGKDRAALWNMLKGARVPTHPTAFHSIDEARHALERTISDIIADLSSINDRLTDHRIPNPRGSEGPITDSRGLEVQKHMSAMQSWNEALDRYLLCASKETLVSSPAKLARGASLLRVHGLVMSIVVGTPETHEDKFGQIISHCEYLLPKNMSSSSVGSNSNFSTDLGILAPLFFTVLRAPKLSLRRQALDLMAKTPRREGMWDSSDAVSVAREALQAAEAHGVAGMITPLGDEDTECRLWVGYSERLLHNSFGQQTETTATILSNSFINGFPTPRTVPSSGSPGRFGMLRPTDHRDSM